MIPQIIPFPSIFPPCYQGYIQRVVAPLTIADFESSSNDLLQFFRNVPSSKYDYRYAEGKWTIKEILKHLIDCERIFVYRALCFARQEPQAMLFFEENDYVVNSNAALQSMEDLMEEWESVRKATISLFKSFTAEDWKRVGKVGTLDIQITAIAYILIGHPLHHMQIFQERYL